MALILKTLLGEHPVSAAVKSGQLRSDHVQLDFADVAIPNTAFKRVVRDLAFDVAELAIMTFLMARDRGVPLTLIPVCLLARMQHPFLVHNVERGPLRPGDLIGKRVGVRGFTVTTAVWLRQILSQDFGVDANAVRWITLEDAHVAGFAEPPCVERAPKGRDLEAMLLSGEIDAAVLPGQIRDARIRPVIANPEAAAVAWRSKYQALQLNHVVVAKTALCHEAPDAAREVYRLFAASKAAAGIDGQPSPDFNPIGAEALKDSLALAIETAYAQGLIKAPMRGDELYDGLSFDA